MYFQLPLFQMNAYLGSEISGHCVDVLGQVLPFTLHILNLGLSTQGSIRSDFTGDLADFKREGAKAVHHLVDGVLQLSNLSPDFDANLLCEVSVGDCCSDLGDLSHLGGKVHGHAVDVLGEVPPGTLDVVDGGLASETAFGADLSRNLGDLARELLQLVNHRVDCGLELEDLTSAVGLNLLREVSLRDGSGDGDDVAHLCGEIVGHGVDVDGEVVPHALHSPDIGLTTQYTFRAHISSNTCDFGCERTELIHHGVDCLLELQDLTLGGPLDLLGKIAVSDCCRDGGDFSD